jgi:uncharacterized protein
MGQKVLLAAVLAGAAAALATPAWADVQDGLNAWARNDYPAAIREWQGPATRGDADAQFLLAEAYKQGRGVNQDLVRAEELYGKAAAQGHMQASDVYGLLLFDRGLRVQAMPYVRAAAERGDPRAQYLLGLAHFNGDLAEKDWVRAYALVSLAQQGGLERAKTALAKMDQYIELGQRQQAAALSVQLASQADANLARQLAASNLGSSAPAARTPAVAKATTTSAIVTSHSAESPRSAGADYARPSVTAAAPTLPAPRPVALPGPAPTTPAPALATGPWRIQLGAFGVAANADALWNRLRVRPELAGHPRINAAAGKIIKLQAGGFASQDAARMACSRLADAGVSCLAVAR